MATTRDRQERDDPHRQIVPQLTGEAVEIMAFLEGLFELSPRDTKPGHVKTEPDAMPERVVLRPVYGKGGREPGQDLHFKNWKPTVSPVPPRETLAALANEFYAKAKKHATTNQTRQRYCLFAYNNVKGPEAYATHPFVASPGPREYGEGDAPASDDEDTHRDRLLATTLAHARWEREQNTESTSGVLKLQQEIIRDQRAWILQMEADRRADRLAAEEALSKAQDRRIQAEWAEAKIKILSDMWSSVRGLLPAAAIYLSKGKVGIPESLKSFADGLSEDQKLRLFGRWGEGGVCLDSGILDGDQVKLVVDIIDGQIEGVRISDLVTSLRADQIAAVQATLRPDQLQALFTLARAASEAAKSAAGAKA